MANRRGRAGLATSTTINVESLMSTIMAQAGAHVMQLAPVSDGELSEVEDFVYLGRFRQVQRPALEHD